MPVIKLCMACPVFYPTFGGGSLRYLRYQPGLCRRGIDTVVLAGTARAKERSQAETESGWHQQPIGTLLPDQRIQGVDVRRVRLPDNTGWRRTGIYFKTLLRLCRQGLLQPDVIQLHSFQRFETLFWLDRLRERGVPLIYSVMLAPTLPTENGFKRKLQKKILQAFYSRMDTIVASTEQVSAFLAKIGVATPVEVIPNGVDLQRFRPAEGEGERRSARALLGVAGDGPVILAVGAVSPRKGSDLLLEGWVRLVRQLPDVSLVFVGPRHDQTNPNFEKFGARLRDLITASATRERVYFLGYNDQVETLYRGADVLVLPTQHEGGTPNVVLEAMASRLAVIITAFYGQSMAIGRPGVEFEQVERNPEALANALQQVLGDSHRRQALASRGRAWVEEHLDVERSLDQYAALYRRLACRR